MVDTLKIFLGGNDFGSDNDELERLRREARSEGYVTFRHHKGADILIGIQKPAEVDIRGGYTGVCVAKAVEASLKAGAKKVRVDLSRCRSTDYDTGDSPDTITQREIDLRDGISAGLKDDARILTTSNKKQNG